MNDLLKNLRALARGKHDDFSVAAEAADEIDDLRDIISQLLAALASIYNERAFKHDKASEYALIVEDMARKAINKATAEYPSAPRGVCLSDDPDEMCKHCTCWKMTRKACG